MLALVRIMSSLLGDPPDLRLRLLQGEDLLSIPRREAAIGFRARHPSQDGLAGRKLRRVAFCPYAAPQAPEQWIVVRASTASAHWLAERCGNAAPLETDTPRLALDLARQGLGRLLLPTFLGDEQPGLERVGSEIDERAHDQWLVTHDEDRHLPEIRRTLNRIAAAFGGPDRSGADRTALAGWHEPPLPKSRKTAIGAASRSRTLGGWP
ncbi:MAG: LysR substrate-binding domain-containing protein [Paracoccus sp. (in: a-proteobacteria)]